MRSGGYYIVIHP